MFLVILSLGALTHSSNIQFDLSHRSPEIMLSHLSTPPRCRQNSIYQLHSYTICIPELSPELCRSATVHKCKLPFVRILRCQNRSLLVSSCLFRLIKCFQALSRSGLYVHPLRTSNVAESGRKIFSRDENKCLWMKFFATLYIDQDSEARTPGTNVFGK